VRNIRKAAACWAWARLNMHWPHAPCVPQLTAAQVTSHKSQVTGCEPRVLGPGCGKGLTWEMRPVTRAMAPQIMRMMSVRPGPPPRQTSEGRQGQNGGRRGPEKRLHFLEGGGGYVLSPKVLHARPLLPYLALARPQGAGNGFRTSHVLEGGGGYVFSPKVVLRRARSSSVPAIPFRAARAGPCRSRAPARGWVSRKYQSRAKHTLCDCTAENNDAGQGSHFVTPDTGHFMYSPQDSERPLAGLGNLPGMAHMRQNKGLSEVFLPEGCVYTILTIRVQASAIQYSTVQVQHSTAPDSPAVCTTVQYCYSPLPCRGASPWRPPH